LTRTIPTPGTLAALTVTDAFDALEPPDVVSGAAAGAAVLVPGGADVLLDEPQAAKRIEAPATATIGKAKTRGRLERRADVIWTSQVGQTELTV
jgi:hypothetical protein